MNKNNFSVALTQMSEPLIITEEQSNSMTRLLSNWNQLPTDMFGETANYETLIVIIGNLYIGIEPDGHTHS